MTKLKLDRNNYKTLVLCIGNSWSCLNWLEWLPWLFLGFEGNQMQTLGMPPSEVAINQLFLFSLSGIRNWYPRGPTWSPNECGLDWQAEAEQRRGRPGRARGERETEQERESLREMLGVGSSEEEPDHHFLGWSDSVNCRSRIGLLFKESNHTNNTGNLGPRELAQKEEFLLTLSWLWHE